MKRIILLLIVISFYKISLSQVTKSLQIPFYQSAYTQTNTSVLVTFIDDGNYNDTIKYEIQKKELYDSTFVKLLSIKTIKDPNKKIFQYHMIDMGTITGIYRVKVTYKGKISYITEKYNHECY